MMNALAVACSYRFELNEFTEAAINLSRESPDEENRLVVSEAAVISFVEFMIMVRMTKRVVRQVPRSGSKSKRLDEWCDREVQNGRLE